MKKSLVTLLIAVLVLLSVIGWTRKGEAYAQETWEYKIITVTPTDARDPGADRVLTRLGEKGWEMIQGNLNDQSGEGVYVFKRRK